MIQNVSPFLEGVEEYLKLKPEHPQLAVRIGRCLHRVGELPYPEPDKPPAKRCGTGRTEKHHPGQWRQSS